MVGKSENLAYFRAEHKMLVTNFFRKYLTANAR